MIYVWQISIVINQSCYGTVQYNTTAMTQNTDPSLCTNKTPGIEEKCLYYEYTLLYLIIFNTIYIIVAHYWYDIMTW